MVWLINKGGTWKLGKNLHYNLGTTYDEIAQLQSQGGGETRKNVEGLKSVRSSKKLWEVTSGRLNLYLYADWKLLNLRRAFAEAIGP